MKAERKEKKFLEEALNFQFKDEDYFRAPAKLYNALQNAVLN